MSSIVDLKDQCEVTAWCRMTDIVCLKNIPFGVYAFTGPEKRKPSRNIWPHEHMGVVYFGIAGRSYDDVYYDRKNKETDTFHKSGQVYQRLRTHRTELGKEPELFVKGASYSRFFEHYGFSETHLEEINVCVMTPRKKLDEYRIRTWLLMIESLSIHFYSENFNYQPLMQVAHSSEANVALIDENSHNQRKIAEVKTNSLEQFFV